MKLVATVKLKEPKVSAKLRRLFNLEERLRKEQEKTHPCSPEWRALEMARFRVIQQQFADA